MRRETAPAAPAIPAIHMAGRPGGARASRSLAAELLDQPGRLGLVVALALARLLAAASLLNVDEPEPDADDQHDIGDVEHRPLVPLVVPQDEVGHDPEVDAIDEVADGAARDQRERPVQDALIRPRL